ncbi:putative reverse transcriptase domain-containing protein [Tanacetum coccineum]
MPPKRTSTSAAPAMTQDAIRQLVADSVATALKAQAANMANTDNTNKNTETSETPVARKGINNHKRKSLHCQVSNLQQGGSFDQELQKQRTRHKKQPAISICNLCGKKGHYKSQCSKIDNSTFHVSKKNLCDKSLIIPNKEILLDDKLNYVEESVEIMD